VSQVGKTREGNWVSSDADVYDKWMQAVSSALAWADDVASGAAPGNAAYVFLPLLVVSDGTLWAADYDDDGALAAGPNAVQELTLYLDRESPSRRTGGIRVSHLHICSETGANELLERASIDCAWRDRLFGN
jgi:hypothetical protein